MKHYYVCYRKTVHASEVGNPIVQFGLAQRRERSVRMCHDSRNVRELLQDLGLLTGSNFAHANDDTTYPVDLSFYQEVYKFHFDLHISFLVGYDDSQPNDEINFIVVAVFDTEETPQWKLDMEE